MSKALEIKTADPSDAAGILKLTGRLAHESRMVTIDPNWSKISVADERKQINIINHTLCNVIIIIKNRDRDIGIITVQKIRPGIGELGVGVEKRFWNLGLGTRLVQEAIRWLNTYSDLNSLVLSVENRNHTAVHVYKKCGFRIISHYQLANSSILITKMKLNCRKNN